MRSVSIICLVLSALLLTVACERTDESPDITREVIHSDNAPEAVGPYSQAIRAGNTLYLAGQVGLDPETGELVGNDIESQSRQALDNLQAVLEEAGFGLEEVVEVQVFLTNIDDYGTFNEIYATYFEESPPARAVVGIDRLPLDAKVEIKMTAVKTQ